MTFFDNFKLTRTKTGYSVKYKEQMLARINPVVVGEIIKDYASQSFLQQITKMIDVEDMGEDVTKKAKQFEKHYTLKRKKYYNNRNLKHIGEKTADFKNFIKAIKIIEDMGVTYKEYLEAQIEGLAFINGGKGVFPKPSQLANTNAEERMLQKLKDKSDDNSIDEVKRIKLTWDDKNTPLMENPNFTSVYKKIERGSASLKEALYVADCMLARNGKVTDMIRDYIQEISGEEY